MARRVRSRFSSKSARLHPRLRRPAERGTFSSRDLALRRLRQQPRAGWRAHRLGQEVDGSQLHGSHRLGNAPVSRDHDHGDLDPRVAETPQVSIPSTTGIFRSSKMRSKGRFLQLRQGHSAIRRLGDLVPRGLQRGPEDQPDVRLVIDDQNAFARVHRIS